MRKSLGEQRVMAGFNVKDDSVVVHTIKQRVANLIDLIDRIPVRNGHTERWKSARHGRCGKPLACTRSRRPKRVRECRKTHNLKPTKRMNPMPDKNQQAPSSTENLSPLVCGSRSRRGFEKDWAEAQETLRLACGLVEDLCFTDIERLVEGRDLSLSSHPPTILKDDPTGDSASITYPPSTGESKGTNKL